MDWQDIIAKRRQVSNYNPDEIVNQNDIIEILNNLHEYLPSKQNQCPYFIDVLDWSNPQLRNEIFLNTIPESARFLSDTNPQTFAPVLFAFTTHLRKIAAIEIGMAALFITYAAIDKGYNTAFCGCISNPNKLARLLGYNRHDFETNLLVAIGKENRIDNPVSRDPRSNQIIRKNRDNSEKPKMKKYVKHPFNLKAAKR